MTVLPDTRREAMFDPDVRQVRRALAAERVEVRAAGGTLTFEGLASSTSARASDGSLTRDNGYDMGWYTERIIAGAFERTLRSNPDVQLLVNHEGLPLARTTNGTLDLRETDRGLEFVARVDEGDPDAARLRSKVDSGLMDQCSFAFRINKRSWDEGQENLDITEVNLNRGDVSVVNYGANPATAVAVRSLLASLDDLAAHELADLRRDPAVMRAARMLLDVAETTAPEAIAEAVTETEAGRISLDLARARAYALNKRHQRR